MRSASVDDSELLGEPALIRWWARHQQASRSARVVCGPEEIGCRRAAARAAHDTQRRELACCGLFLQFWARTRRRWNRCHRRFNACLSNTRRRPSCFSALPAATLQRAMYTHTHRRKKPRVLVPRLSHAFSLDATLEASDSRRQAVLPSSSLTIEAHPQHFALSTPRPPPPTLAADTAPQPSCAQKPPLTCAYT